MITPIFFDKRQSVDGVESFSRSASKPGRFAELMAHYDYRSYATHHLGRVTPIQKKDLYRVHRKEHVDRIFDLIDPNGFEDCNPLVPESTLWTIGSLLSASRHAMKYPAIPVMSPTSGFHHSGYKIGSGAFCTFNGLMVVVAKLVSENNNFRACVLDLDMHHGNGTQDILMHHQELAKQCLHFTSGQHFYGDDPKSEAKAFQKWLVKSIEEINAFKPDLVIYQAGVDSHMDDPLGGYLTTEQMALRDRTVFEGVHAPIVFNMAGGYQESKDGTIFTDPVLQLHRNTLLESDKSITQREAFFAPEVPAGYTAAELERDSPFNQWMYES